MGPNLLGLGEALTGVVIGAFLTTGLGIIAAVCNHLLALSAQREERTHRQEETREQELRVRRERRVVLVLEFLEKLSSFHSLELLDRTLKDLSAEDGVSDEDRRIFEHQRERIGHFGAVPSELVDSYVAALTAAPTETIYSMIYECLVLTASDGAKLGEARRRITTARDALDTYVVGS
jgi:hypothetical protein